jgi:sulfoxide reductase heme-binding subunit YedZ
MSTPKLLQSWRLLAVLSTALLALAMTAFLFHPGIAGVRSVLRLTARTSFILFLAAFSASSIWKLWPSPWSRWQLANRRYLGLSFAVSHSLHLMGIASLALAQPTRFREDNDISTLIIGGIAYAFILAMAATSFDRSAAWLGPRRWKILHTVGSYYIWATFAIVLVTIALEVPHYWVGVALLVLALLLRLLARWTQRRKSFVATTPAASPQ